ncbi:hypothetical protein BVG19_g1193 [[Candida] boidinii]|nr:hypothetical protein BVG19_g1193 [[Candida] boidinii]OWB52302.1 hypothetical protein B5S27_g3876 [[Candida] boidinii]
MSESTIVTGSSSTGTVGNSSNGNAIVTGTQDESQDRKPSDHRKPRNRNNNNSRNNNRNKKPVDSTVTTNNDREGQSNRRNNNRSKKNDKDTDSKANNKSDGNKQKPENKNRGKSTRNGGGNNNNSPGSNLTGRDRFLHNKKLEIFKLIKNFKPITINGVPISKLTKTPEEYITELIERKQENEFEDMSIYLLFLLQPSDPEFPYDLEFLKVSLCIPKDYPFNSNKNKPLTIDSRPTVSILNDDIPRGFSVNIEIGFKSIVNQAYKNKTERNHFHNRKNKNKQQSNDAADDDKTEESGGFDLDNIDMTFGNDITGMLKTMDKYLEKFLSMEKKDTIKIVKTIKRITRDTTASDSTKITSTNNNSNNKSESDKVVFNVSNSISKEIINKRDFDILKFKQRLSKDEKTNLKLFKETPQNFIFKLNLKFENDSFIIAIEGLNDEINIELLPIKLSIPKDYLNNPKKFIRLEVDMSNEKNLNLIKSFEDPNLKLVFGKLINNINNNFLTISNDFAKLNCDYISGASESDELESSNNIDNNNIHNKRYFSITSQINFFTQNIEKFLNEKNEFNKWFELNKKFNINQ